MPSALSTSRTPSRVTSNDMANCLQNFGSYFGKGAAHARAGSQNVSAAAAFLADGANIDIFIFCAHAHAHLAVGQFLEENRDNNSTNRAQTIHHAFLLL